MYLGVFGFFSIGFICSKISKLQGCLISGDPQRKSFLTRSPRSFAKLFDR